MTHPAPTGLRPAAAIDGKLLHGTRTQAGQVFLVGAITHDRGIILGQRQVPNKRGENAVIADLLTPLNVAGMMLTLDALHTTKKTARLITGPLDAHYTLILKGNQPLALQAAHRLLAGTDTEFIDSMNITTDRGHGRTERRTLRVAPCDDTLFPGARQVFRLRRDTGGLDGVRMPRMNAVMERWVQTCRRELLDRTLIWDQRHLLHAPRPRRCSGLRCSV